MKLFGKKANNDCFSSEQQNQTVIVISDRLKIGNITFYYIIKEIYSHTLHTPEPEKTINLMNIDLVCCTWTKPEE